MALLSANNLLSRRLLVALCGVLLGSHAVSARWTILIYMMADENLECTAVSQMNELSKALGPSLSTTEFYVYWDRLYSDCPEMQALTGASSWVTTPWVTGKDFVLLGGSWYEVADWGEVNQGDPAELSSFITRGIMWWHQQAPIGTDRDYMLVLWDHGGSFMGFGDDYTCAPLTSCVSLNTTSTFSLNTLKRGVRDGLAGAGVSSFSLLGFPASIMGGLEVAGVMREFTKHYVFSELNAPAEGWDWTVFARLLTNPDMSPAALGGLIVDGAVARAARNDSICTWASVATSDFLSWADLINAMCLEVISVAGLLPAVAEKVSISAINALDVPGSPMLIDLLSFAHNFNDSLQADPRTAGQAALIRKVEAVINGYKTALKAKFGSNRADSGWCGLHAAFLSPAERAVPAITEALASVLRLTNVDAVKNWNKMNDVVYAKTKGAVDTLKEQYGQNNPGVLSSAFITGLDTPPTDPDQKWPRLSLSGDYYMPAVAYAYGVNGFLNLRNPRYMVQLHQADAAVADATSISGDLYLTFLGLRQQLPGELFPRVSLAQDYSVTVNSTTTASSGLMTQIPVIYTSASAGCTTPIEQWVAGQLTAYVPKAGSPNFELFVNNEQSAGPSISKAEMPQSSGGVLIPYMDLMDLLAGGVTSTAAYAGGCFKWGYPLEVIRGDPTFWRKQLPGTYLDLRKDYSVALPSYLLDQQQVLPFPVTTPGTMNIQATVSGCRCKASWRWTDKALYKGCVVPAGYVGSAVCQVSNATCPGGVAPEVAGVPSGYDKCAVGATVSGCRCKEGWLNGQSGCVMANNPLGEQRLWCKVNEATCPSSARSHGTADTSWDFCAAKTVRGCQCSRAWQDQSSVVQSGTCVTQNDPATGIQQTWCPLDSEQPSTCALATGGAATSSWDYCTPPAGRVSPSKKTCLLPNQYLGVPVYNCIGYAAAGDAAAAAALADSPVKQWCSAADASKVACAADTCSGAFTAACEGTGALANNDNIALCLNQMCNVWSMAGYQRGICYLDTDTQVADMMSKYLKLQSNAAIKNYITSLKLGTTTVEGYCGSVYGLRAMAIISDTCPFADIFGSLNYAWKVPTPSSACEYDCLQAACRIYSQIQAGTKVAGVYWASAFVQDTYIAYEAAGQQGLSQNCTVPYTSPAARCYAVLSGTPDPSVCPSPAIATAVRGSWTSTAPGTATYSANSNCMWVVDPEDGLNYIRLMVHALDLEPRYDWLNIYDGNGLVASLTGTRKTDLVYYTTTGVMFVEFTSDDTQQSRGFNITYSTYKLPPVPSVPSCAAGLRLVTIYAITSSNASQLSWAITNGGDSMSNGGVVAYGGVTPAGMDPDSATLRIAWPAVPNPMDNYDLALGYACLAADRSFTLWLLSQPIPGSSGGWYGATANVGVSDQVLVSSATVPNGTFKATFPFTVPSGPNAVAPYPLSGPNRFPMQLTFHSVTYWEYYMQLRNPMIRALCQLATIPRQQIQVVTWNDNDSNGTFNIGLRFRGFTLAEDMKRVRTILQKTKPAPLMALIRKQATPIPLTSVRITAMTFNPI